MLRGEVEIKRYYIKPEVETREHVNRDIEENRMKYEVEKAILAIESQDWLYHWHLFIDHLSKGKDIESFFERL